MVKPFHKAWPLNNNMLEELLVTTEEVSREVGADLKCRQVCLSGTFSS